MQAYTASGPELVRIEMSGLDGKPIPAALYMPDADLSHWSKQETQSWSRNYLSIPVDGIPNFTRIPEVWFWMVRHYHTSQQLMPGIVGLVRDDSRASRIALQAQSIGLPQKKYEISERESAIDIGTPNWPSGYDFLRLRLKVHYSQLWKLRKPERLQVEITRADGSRDLQWVVLPPNTSTEIWFYPWAAPDLADYFNPDAGKWRLNSRSPITGLRFIVTPLDWVSAQPQAIEIEGADAVRLVMAEGVSVTQQTSEQHSKMLK
jgi:hypothetical protein